MKTIDIKKRLVDKVIEDVIEMKKKAPQELAEKDEQLQEIVDSMDDISSLVALHDEMFYMLSDTVHELDEIRADGPFESSESLAEMYFGCMLASGKMEASIIGMRKILSRICELEPKIVNEHMLKMVERLRKK